MEVGVVDLEALGQEVDLEVAVAGVIQVIRGQVIKNHITNLLLKDPIREVAHVAINLKHTINLRHITRNLHNIPTMYHTLRPILINQLTPLLTLTLVTNKAAFLITSKRTLTMTITNLHLNKVKHTLIHTCKYNSPIQTMVTLIMLIKITKRRFKKLINLPQC